MKQLWKDRSDRLFPIIVFILFFIILSIGLCLDLFGFLNNFLAEISGLLVGIIVAWFIVDEFIKRRKKREWAMVSQTTNMGLAFALGRIYAQAIYCFEAEYGDEEIRLIGQVLNPGENTINSMKEIKSRICQIEANVLVGGEEIIEGRVKAFYKNLGDYHECIQSVVDRISGILIPRLMQYSEDQELIEALFVFEQTVYFGYDTIDQVFGMMNQGIALETIHERFGNWASTLLNASINVYRELCKEWHPGQVGN